MVVWVWEPTGLYTIKYLYTFLCFGGAKTYLSRSVWSLKIPLKHKLFFGCRYIIKFLLKITFESAIGHVMFLVSFVQPLNLWIICSLNVLLSLIFEGKLSLLIPKGIIKYYFYS
jgi:hypothetical protein